MNSKIFFKTTYGQLLVEKLFEQQKLLHNLKKVDSKLQKFVTDIEDKRESVSGFPQITFSL